MTAGGARPGSAAHLMRIIVSVRRCEFQSDCGKSAARIGGRRCTTRADWTDVALEGVPAKRWGGRRGPRTR
jgi:hypothetical protein